MRVDGTVFPRIHGQMNEHLETGEIEVRGTGLEVLTRAEPLPIQVDYAADEELPGEDLRLRYRYLDLRRPALLRNFVVRHRAAQSARAFLSGQGFLEVETPLLTKPTPEGARDFLVPSRVHPGEFYALPQSPQIYKQLLMVSGFDRYFQIAKCLRDEDLRADRQPEFTQIDAEMAFVDEEDVFRAGRGADGGHLPRGGGGGAGDAVSADHLRGVDGALRHRQAGPALRAGDRGRDGGAAARGLPHLPGGAGDAAAHPRAAHSRRRAAVAASELDELQEVAKRGGAAGALWVKRGEDGALAGQFAKGLDEGLANAFYEATGVAPGDLFVAVVGRFRGGEGGGGAEVDGALDELRRHLARKLDLIDTTKHAWLWVTEFPVFDWDADHERLVYAHNPFSMPLGRGGGGHRGGHEGRHAVRARWRGSCTGWGCARGRTTRCTTARRWRAARCASTCRPGSRRCSRRWGSGRRRRRPSSASCWRRTASARRRTRASRSASTGW